MNICWIVWYAFGVSNKQLEMISTHFALAFAALTQTNLATILRVSGAKTNTKGKAHNQANKKARNQRIRKCASIPVLRAVKIPDIQKAMNIDMIRENNSCCFFSFDMSLIPGLADYALL